MFSVAENSRLTAKAPVANIKIGAVGNQKHTTEVGKTPDSPIVPIISGCSSHCTLPVCFMKLHNLLFKLFCLVWGQFKFADVIGAV